MGFSSGSEIFDDIAQYIVGDALVNAKLLSSEEVIALSMLSDTQKVALVKVLVDALENHDWDDSLDHDYRAHPIFLKAIRDLHPEWRINDEGYSDD